MYPHLPHSLDLRLYQFWGNKRFKEPKRMEEDRGTMDCQGSHLMSWSARDLFFMKIKLSLMKKIFQSTE